MMRYKIIIEYCGTGFVGWQRQKDGLAVQQVIEDAITKFCRFTYPDYPYVEITGAGRTDSGVHAFAQVAHFDLDIGIDIKKFVESINFFMRPSAIKIIDMNLVKDTFHARHSALQRHYLYRIVTRAFPVEIEKNRVWHIRESLDANSMHRAAQYLLGKHDFSSFRASSCQANNAVRSISEVTVKQCKYEGLGNELQIRVSAQSFLHHMVRNIVGSLVVVGRGEWTAEDFQKVLLAKNRNVAAPTSPACGLYFHHVEY